jgi:hypothetical protein
VQQSSPMPNFDLARLREEHTRCEFVSRDKESSSAESVGTKAQLGAIPTTSATLNLPLNLIVGNGAS